jgi:hypothetical protein
MVEKVGTLAKLFFANLANIPIPYFHMLKVLLINAIMHLSIVSLEVELTWKGFLALEALEVDNLCNTLLLRYLFDDLNV